MPPCDMSAYPSHQTSNTTVSILVLVDAALRHVHNIVRGTYTIVSILVLVDAALRHIIALVIVHQFRVSILVLVDAALRLATGIGEEGLEYCFNPCFSGCRPATRVGMVGGGGLWMFQSLF